MAQTIEEIARGCAEKVTDRLIYHKGLKSQYGHILDALNEQDRIAREEERKRCINAFCKIECGRLANETCPNTDSCILDCKKYKSFCKAIEEGGKNGND